MSILSPFTGLLRSALGVTEHEAAETVEHSPLQATVALEGEVERLAHALSRSAESADRQVEVLGGVARSLPALIEQVTALTAQAEGINARLDELMKLLSPVGGAERDVSRVERVFRRRRHRRDGHPGDDQP